MDDLMPSTEEKSAVLLQVSNVVDFAVKPLPIEKEAALFEFGS